MQLFLNENFSFPFEEECYKVIFNMVWLFLVIAF